MSDVLDDIDPETPLPRLVLQPATFQAKPPLLDQQEPDRLPGGTQPLRQV